MSINYFKWNKNVVDVIALQIKIIILNNNIFRTVIY